MYLSNFDHVLQEIYSFCNFSIKIQAFLFANFIISITIQAFQPQFKHLTTSIQLTVTLS